MLPSRLLSHLVPNCHLPGMLQPTSGILRLPLHLLGSCQDGIEGPPSQVDWVGKCMAFKCWAVKPSVSCWAFPRKTPGSRPSSFLLHSRMASLLTSHSTSITCMKRLCGGIQTMETTNTKIVRHFNLVHHTNFQLSHFLYGDSHCPNLTSLTI